VSNQSGRSVHEYFYDPYGAILDNNGHPQDSSNWTDPHNHYLFSGKEWDEESRSVYFGARYYDPDAAVWTTLDTYRGEVVNPATLHRTLYVLANPTTLMDAYGYYETNGESRIKTPRPPTPPDPPQRADRLDWLGEKLERDEMREARVAEQTAGSTSGRGGGLCQKTPWKCTEEDYGGEPVIALPHYVWTGGLGCALVEEDTSGLCVRTTPTGTFQITRGGSVFVNWVEVKLANAILANDPRRLSGLPGKWGLPMLYTSVGVATNLGYQIDTPGIMANLPQLMIGSYMLAKASQEARSGEPLPASVVRTERLWNTQTQWDAAAEAAARQARQAMAAKMWERSGADLSDPKVRQEIWQGRPPPISGGSGLSDEAFEGLGSLPPDTAKQIQAVVEGTGRPINVIGGYAVGKPPPRKDIDYLADSVQDARMFDESGLPIGPEQHPVFSHDAPIKPYIRFEPGKPPQYNPWIPGEDW
jgi:RHS repeat-associated protein